MPSSSSSSRELLSEKFHRRERQSISISKFDLNDRDKTPVATLAKPKTRVIKWKTLRAKGGHIVYIAGIHTNENT